MERNFYITRSPAGPVGCTSSFYEALEAPHKLSAQLALPFVPSEIECLNTGERFNTGASARSDALRHRRRSH